MANNPPHPLPHAFPTRESLPSIAHLLHHLHVEKSPEMSSSATAQIAVATNHPSSTSTTPSSKSSSLSPYTHVNPSAFAPASSSDCRKLSLAFLLTTDEPVNLQSKDVDFSSPTDASKAPRLDTDFILKSMPTSEQPSPSLKDRNKSQRSVSKASSSSSSSKRPSRRKDTSQEDAEIVQSILQTIDKDIPISPNQITITKTIPRPTNPPQYPATPVLSLTHGLKQESPQIRPLSLDESRPQHTDNPYPQWHEQPSVRQEPAEVTATKHFEPVYSIGAATNIRPRSQSGTHSTSTKALDSDNYFRFPAQSSFTYYDFKPKPKPTKKDSPQPVLHESISQFSARNEAASSGKSHQQQHHSSK